MAESGEPMQREMSVASWESVCPAQAACFLPSSWLSHRSMVGLCSFCRKSQNDVKVLVGPGVNICYECVALCNDLIAAEWTGRARLRDISLREQLRARVLAALKALESTLRRNTTRPNYGCLRKDEGPSE